MLRSMAELALDALPGSGLARVAFEQMRTRLRRDLEEELDALRAERGKDQATIARLADVVERQQGQLDRLLAQKLSGQGPQDPQA